MSIRNISRLLPIVAVAFVMGCATTGPNDGAAPTARWKTQQFSVFFRAGPRSEDGRAFSYYQVSKRAGGPGSELVLESAHTAAGFRAVTNGDPRNYIRIIEDASGQSLLLIEEDVPNEAGPSKNYLFVFQDERGFLDHKYLRLPAISHGTGGIDTEFPSVTKLRGSALTYRYSTGEEITRDIRQIRAAAHPVPPG